MDVGEALATEWRHLRHPHATAAQAAATTKGTPVSLAQDLHQLAARVEHLGDEVLASVETIAANPETATLVKDVAALVGLNPPPGVIANALGSIRALLIAYTPAQQQPAPAS